MKIIVDAFGGDNAPLEILKGAIAAKNEYGCDILLCGDEELIRACAKENAPAPMPPSPTPATAPPTPLPSAPMVDNTAVSAPSAPSPAASARPC